MDSLQIVIYHWIREENIIKKKNYLQNFIYIRSMIQYYKKIIHLLYKDDFQIREICYMSKFFIDKKVCMGINKDGFPIFFSKNYTDTGIKI